MAKGPKVTEEEKARMAELKAQGLSISEIAQRVGKAYVTVYKHLREMKKPVDA